MIQWLDGAMAAIFGLVLVVGLVVTVASRGIQIRGLWGMVRLLLQKPVSGGAGETVDGRKALFTAMSTTIGIGNLVGPIVAIGFGGPGALICYLLASVLGAATTYAEVSFALRYRRVLPDGRVQGGPMPYVGVALGKRAAKLYAACASVLLFGWSTSQANTLSGLMQPHGIPTFATGMALALAVFLILRGGISRVGRLNEAMVPVMFVMYTVACVWIIGCHAGALPGVMSMIGRSFFQPRAVIAGIGVHSTIDMLRWGLARAVHANEAGVGTATIPHSMAHGRTPEQQGLLAMASVYANGLLCLLTGVTVLVSGAWAQPGASFDISLLAGIFRDHFAVMGEWPLGLCAFLFAFGTIIGNSYNGGQCLAYLRRSQSPIAYQLAAALLVLLGALASLRFVWSLCDYLLLPVALIHSLALLRLVWRGELEERSRAMGVTALSGEATPDINACHHEENPDVPYQERFSGTDARKNMRTA